MKKGPRFISLAIIGALFFGLLIYVLLRITQIQETQEATQTRVEIDTAALEEIVDTADAEMVLSVDALDDPIETDEWKRAEFDVAPLSFDYPSDWDLNKVAPLEWYVETADGTSIKVRIADYETAPSEFNDNTPLTLTQADLDARREAIDTDEDATRINGFTAVINVQRDTSSLSVVAITEFFLDKDYVIISLPFDVTHLYDSAESETLIDAFITELKEGLPKEAASVSDIRSYQYYRELVQSIARTDIVEEDDADPEETTDDTTTDEGITDEADEEDIVAGVPDADGNTLYTNEVAGFSLSIPEGWSQPGVEPATLEGWNTLVNASLVNKDEARKEGDVPSPAPYLADINTVISDLQGTGTTTIWTDSANIVLPVTVLENGSRAGVYIGGGPGSYIVKQYTVLTPEDELLQMHVSPNELHERLYPDGRQSGLITPRGELSEDAEQELIDLFATFDTIVNSLEWIE